MRHLASLVGVAAANKHAPTQAPELPLPRHLRPPPLVRQVGRSLGERGLGTRVTSAYPHESPPPGVGRRKGSDTVHHMHSWLECGVSRAFVFGFHLLVM